MPKQLFALGHAGRFLFRFDDRKCTLTVTPVTGKSDLESRRDERQLVCEPPVSAPPLGANAHDGPFIRLNATCTKLCIYWSKGALFVVYLPSRTQLLAGDHLPIRCNTVRQPVVSVIRDLKWHPRSPDHLCVLNDSRLDMFNFGRKTKCWENTFLCSQYASFCFGGYDGWSAFTVLLLKPDSAQIHYLCPVIPDGAKVTNIHFNQLTHWQPTSSLDKEKRKTMLGNFQQNPETSTYVYTLKRNPTDVRVQVLDVAHARVSSSMGQGVHMISFPNSFPFPHFIRIYQHGKLEVGAGIIEVHPKWGLERPDGKNASRGDETNRLISLQRTQIGHWKKDSGKFCEIVSYDLELEGVLIRNSEQTFVCEVLGLLQFHDVARFRVDPVEDEDFLSEKEAAESALNEVLLSEPKQSVIGVDGGALSFVGGIQLVDMELSRLIIGQKSQRELISFNFEEQLGVEVEFPSDSKEAHGEVPANFHQVLGSLRNLRKSVDESKGGGIDNLDAHLTQLMTLTKQVAIVGADPTMKELSNRFTLVNLIDQRLDRLHCVVKYPQKYVMMYSKLVALQESLKTYSSSIEHVCFFICRPFLNSSSDRKRIC
jgi:hypothetical protein